MQERAAEEFSGDWTVEVIASTGNLRFIIEGSRASDGAHGVGLAMPPLAVSGAHWRIRFQAFSPIRPKGWLGTSVRRIGATCTLQAGLDAFLLSNYFYYESDQVFDGACTLRCRNVEPRLNPWLPFKNPYDFTVPPRRREPPIPTGVLGGRPG